MIKNIEDTKYNFNLCTFMYHNKNKYHIIVVNKKNVFTLSRPMSIYCLYVGLIVYSL